MTRHWHESDVARARRRHRQQLDHDLRLALGDGRARRRRRAGHTAAFISIAAGIILLALIL